jgi:hypothetical protein
MTDAAHAAGVFFQAAELNRTDPLLKGSLLEFPHFGQLVMTGDLHGHRRNFERLQRYCDLEHYAPRHVILHEIIHEEVYGMNGADDSHEILLAAAEWKVQFPDQVHFLMGNHDLAQLTGNEITKNGRFVTLEFEESVHRAYGVEGTRVLEAIRAFLYSLPLAGRTPNRVFLSHSLPAPRDLPMFDPTVLTRTPTTDDLSDRGSAHLLVWGRYPTQESLSALKDMLDADFFLCGHQPQETGYDVLHECMIILASDHNHGVFLSIDLSKPQSLESLTRNIRPLAAIA